MKTIQNKAEALRKIQTLATGKRFITGGDGSMNDILSIRKLMRDFEITEAEVNEMLGEKFLASDRKGLKMGQPSKVRTTPYGKNFYFDWQNRFGMDYLNAA